jgi:hypothetical protein
VTGFYKMSSEHMDQLIKILVDIPKELLDYTPELRQKEYKYGSEITLDKDLFNSKDPNGGKLQILMSFWRLSIARII